MKRLSLLGFVGLLASVLAGCPIFSGDQGQGQGGASQGCVGVGCPSQCSSPSDCPANETCGSDGACHSGDCSFTKCVAGYTCATSPGTIPTCVPGSTGTGGTGGTTTTTTTSTTTTTTSTTTTTTPPPPVYCGHPADCTFTGQICGSAGTCVVGPCSGSNACVFGYTCQTDGTCKGAANACDKDTDCASGSLCIAGPGVSGGGVCTAVADQCFDQSQCGTNEKCVAGKCTLGCASDTDCRDGFKCDTNHGGVCTIPVTSCNLTNDCGSATLVCVGGACVPRSTGGTCSNAGDVWTENGCIPNQGATFNCTTEGQLGTGAGNPGVSCAAGSICMHRDCWLSCDSPNQTACSGQTILNTCKPVVDGASTYNVCGTSKNLGSACGAGSAGNMACPGAGVCIDGFCK